MTEANQQQATTQGSANRLNKPASTEDAGMGQKFSDLVERARSGELKARMRYFLFRKGQEAKRSDSLFSRYKKRLSGDWQKWLGIAAGVTGLIMLFSPEEFWLWQIPLVFILMTIAPAFFELPNTLNALFGHTERQYLVGGVITLTQGIKDGKGKTTLNGEEWQVSGPDCLAGTSVQIVTLDSKTLYVVQADPENLDSGGIQDGG